MSPEEERECPACLMPVDDQGYTTTDCPLNVPPGTCDDCGACFCDGSC